MEYKHEESKQLLNELITLGYPKDEIIRFIPINRKPNTNDIKFIIQQLTNEERHRELSNILKGTYKY